jgi:hypothetical protein
LWEKDDLQLALQLSIWVAMTICSSLQLNVFLCVNVIGQVTWVAKDATHHMWNCIHMQFVWLNCNYEGTTSVQLLCN